jgi:hypothetical protein
MAHPQRFTEQQPTVDHLPKESVILALTDSWATVDARVAAIWPQCRRKGTELVVVCAATLPQLATARSRYPGARFVVATSGAALGQLRRLGLEAASGHIVTMVDSRSSSVGRLDAPEHDLRLESVS